MQTAPPAKNFAGLDGLVDMTPLCCTSAFLIHGQLGVGFEPVQVIGRSASRNGKSSLSGRESLIATRFWTSLGASCLS